MDRLTGKQVAQLLTIADNTQRGVCLDEMYHLDEYLLRLC